MAASSNCNMNEHNENGEISSEHSHFLLNLCKVHKDDIFELSHENGYPLKDRNKFNRWNLRSALIKLIRIPSDSKLSELLSLHINANSKNAKKIKSELEDDAFYAEELYYYLNIQINDKECIHVRIFSKNGKRDLQAILYKSVRDKLRQF